MFAAQGGAARYEAWQGRRLLGLLLIVLVVMAIIYLAKRIMSK
jgi:flagellar biogenesis protein FliO